MSSNLDAFVKRMNQLAVVYERTPRDAVTAAARTYTTAIRREIGAVTAGGKLRGVGQKGARVGVKYDVRGSESHPTAIVQATGPLQLLERDTKSHDIPRTQGSRRLRTAAGRLSHKREATSRKFTGRSILVINGQPITGPVHHPGTKGKHPFARGVRAAENASVTAAVVSLSNSIARILRG